MLVDQVMRRDPVAVALATPVADAVALMAEHSLAAVPVVDGAGRLRGLLGSEAAVGAGPPAYVGDVCSRQVVGVGLEDSAADAVELMSVTGTSTLPVVDRHGVLVGAITRGDVVDALARPDEDVEAEVRGLFAQMGAPHEGISVTGGVVRVVGAAGGPDRALARVAALTVPGVREVEWA